MPYSLAIAALSLLPMSAEPSDAWRVGSSLNSLSYVENNAIYDFVKGKESDYKRGENAFTFNELSLSAQYKSFSLSYVHRYEWFLDYSKDTMALYGSVTNGTLLDADKVYGLDLDIHYLNAEGLRLAYMHQLDNINLYFAGSYLQARELLEGSASGDIELTGSCGDGFECYTGNLDLSYTYSDDVLFDREVSAQQSLYGYSFDIGIDWIINENVFTSVYIQDLFSEIFWEDYPYTDASATTSTTTIEDGKYKIDPVINGYEGNSDYKQTLPTKYNFLLGYQLSSAHLTYLQGFYSFGATVFNVGYRFYYADSLYGLKLYPLDNALGVEFKNKYFNISLAGKPFDYQDSEVLEIKFGVSIPIG